MPKFLEAKLKREYGAKSAIPYKVMNKLGVMHGNKITPKGVAMERQHTADHPASMHSRHPHNPISNLKKRG